MSETLSIEQVNTALSKMGFNVDVGHSLPESHSGLPATPENIQSAAEDAAAEAEASQTTQE